MRRDLSPGSPSRPRAAAHRGEASIVLKPRARPRWGGRPAALRLAAALDRRENGSYDIYLVRPGRAQRCVTPRNASRGRRRRRQHRLGNIPQQVAVSLDVRAEPGILPLLFIKPHPQSIALVDEHLLLPPQRIVLLLEVF